MKQEQQQAKQQAEIDEDLAQADLFVDACIDLGLDPQAELSDEELDRVRVRMQQLDN